MPCKQTSGPVCLHRRPQIAAARLCEGFAWQEKADEGGQIQYEVLTKKADGSKIEYILMPDGSLDSTEEKLGKDALPDAIAGTVKTAVGDGQIKGVEKVTKGDAVTYEVGYKNSKGAEMEAVVSSEGKLIKNGVDAD